MSGASLTFHWRAALSDGRTLFGTFTGLRSMDEASARIFRSYGELVRDVEVRVAE